MTTKPKLLSGGNPQIPKGDGNAPVDAYLAAMPEWKGEIGRALDALVVDTLPKVRKAVRWNSPFYGIEDQGWVAWFTIAAAFNKKITIYGDGKQIRDVLFIDDLVEAYDLAIKNRKMVNGKAFNIGGGHFQMSLLELLAFLEKFIGQRISIQFSDWRPGDQKVYVSNNAKAGRDFKWKPRTSVENGARKLYDWVNTNKEIFQKVGII